MLSSSRILVSWSFSYVFFLSCFVGFFDHADSLNKGNIFLKPLQKIKSLIPLQRPNILDVVSFFDNAIYRFKALNPIDFTAGAYLISSPMPSDISSNANASLTLVSSLQPLSNQVESDDMVRASPLLRIHQLGKKIVRRVPDNTLLGILVLIASELLTREVNSKTSIIPPIFQSFANTTIAELDNKLQTLSQLQWDFDPFIQAELERLQTQPLEAIDRFLVSDVLPRVDRELSPVLAKLTTDPAKVKVITNNIKEIIQISTFLIIKPSKYSSPTYSLQESILEGVDVLGKGVEDGTRTPSDTPLLYITRLILVGIKQWNRALEELGKVVKAESIISLLPQNSYLNSEESTASMVRWLNSIIKPKSKVLAVAKAPEPWYSNYLIPSSMNTTAFFNMTVNAKPAILRTGLQLRRLTNTTTTSRWK
jgi:hypothetical protein